MCILRSSVSNPFCHGITQNPVRSPFPLIRVVYRLYDFGQVVKLCIKPGYTLLSVQCKKPSCFIINVDVDRPLCIFHWYLYFACLNLYELRYPFWTFINCFIVQLRSGRYLTFNNWVHYLNTYDGTCLSPTCR